MEQDARKRLPAVRRLGRDASTISRELRRNASSPTYDLEYEASTAQWHCERRARRPKDAKLVINERLRDYVQQRLSGEVRGSDGAARSGRPGMEGTEQAAPRRSVLGPGVESWTNREQALPRELVACLRTGRALRVPRARTRQKAWAHVTPEVLITKRPDDAEDRAIPGHWEGSVA